MSYWGRPLQRENKAIVSAWMAHAVPDDISFFKRPRIFPDFGNKYALELNTTNRAAALVVHLDDIRLAMPSPTGLLAYDPKSDPIRVHVMLTRGDNGPNLLALVDEWIDACAFHTSISNRATVSAQLLGRNIVDRILAEQPVNPAQLLAGAHYALEFGGLQRQQVELLRARIHDEASTRSTTEAADFSLIVPALAHVLGETRYPELLRFLKAQSTSATPAAPVLAASARLAMRLVRYAHPRRLLSLDDGRVSFYLERLAVSRGAVAFYQHDLRENGLMNAICDNGADAEGDFLVHLHADDRLTPYEETRTSSFIRRASHSPTFALRRVVDQAEIREERVALNTRVFKNERLTLSSLPRRRRKLSQAMQDLINGPAPTYKDPGNLARYVSTDGRIVPNRYTGVTARRQREIARQIKIARFLGLLPYQV